MLAAIKLEVDESNEIDGVPTARSLGAKEKSESGNTWERAFRDTVVSGRVGALNVDPEFFVFESQACK